MSFLQGLHHLGRDPLAGVRPGVEHLVVPLLVGDDPALVQLVVLGDLFLRLGDDVVLGGRGLEIVGRERKPRAGRFPEPEVLHAVQKRDGLAPAQDLVAVGDDPLKLLLTEGRVVEGHLGVQDVVEDHPPRRGLHDHAGREFLLAVAAQLLVRRQPQLDHRVHADLALAVGQEDLVGRGEDHAVAQLVGAADRQVVRAHDDVLGRADDRVAVGRAEDVVGGHHQGHGLDLGLDGKGQVHGHLVAVEIGVESLADQGVNADRVALDEHRLERLDAHAVQGRRPVEQDRVIADDLFEDVPHLVAAPFEHLLGRLDGVGVPQLLEPADDERLKELKRDLLGQPALVELEVRPDDDHRPGRVVDTLAQQVLAEPALLALDHVGERLERPVRRTQHGALAAVVVEEGVDGLLEHPLLVADDHFRRVQVDQLLEPVVAVDDSPVQVVQVAGGEVARIQQHQGAQVRRNHRNALQNHPLGAVVAVAQRLDHLEPLGQVFDLLLAGGFDQFLAQLLGQADEIQPHEHLADRLGAHVGLERVAVLLLALAELFLGQELALLERGVAGIDDRVVLEVDDPFQAGRLHVQEGAQPAGHGLEEPDVDDRRGQLDVAHPLAADPRVRHLHAAAVADHPLVLHAAVLAAGALPVFLGSEDPLAEQAVFLGPVGPVIDRFRLLHFAERPAPNVVRAGKPDLDGTVIIDTIVGTFAHAHETLSSAGPRPCRSGVVGG